MKVRLTPNSQYVADMKKKLKDNDGYCPCSLVKNADTKCMCNEFRDMIDRGETGTCHCGLYIAEEG